MDPKAQPPVPITPPTATESSAVPPSIQAPQNPAPIVTPAAQTEATPSDPLIDEIEKDLVQHIIENLEESKMTVEQAQSLAQEFLALLPFQDKHDLVQKLNALSEKYNEAKAVYIKFAGPVVEEERQQKITEMAAHIKSGNIDEALAVAKGGSNAS